MDIIVQGFEYDQEQGHVPGEKGIEFFDRKHADILDKKNKIISKIHKSNSFFIREESNLDYSNVKQLSDMINDTNWENNNGIHDVLPIKLNTKLTLVKPNEFRTSERKDEQNMSKLEH